MKIVKVLSMTLLMSVFCVGMTFAQQQHQGQRNHQQGTQQSAEQRAAKQVEKMKESLNLSSDQVSRLQAVQTQFINEEQQARNNGNQQDMKARMDNYDSQVKSILNKEQYQKWQSQRQNMMQGKNQKGANYNKNQKNGNYNRNQKDANYNRNQKDANYRDQHQQGNNESYEQRASRQLESMRSSLNLSPDQLTKLQAAQSLWSNGGNNGTQQEIKARMDKYNSQVKSILNKDQFKKYQQQYQNMLQD